MTPLRPRSFFPLAATPETNPRKHIKAFSPLQLFSLCCLTKPYLQKVECEERSAEEGGRGVQDLRVRDIPAESLREKEAEFSDLVMEVKGVEKEGERRKLVEESHQEVHEGGYHLFMKLLRKGVFWKEMKKECREEVKKCDNV